MIHYLIRRIGLRAYDNTQDPSVDQSEIFPFSKLYLEINVKYRCPYCGKDTEMYRCTCNEFTEKFAKLQEKYGDMDHQTQIHLQPCENISCRNKSVKTTIEPLSIQEICLINPKLWNAAIKVDDMETNSSFSIINASYDGEKLEFICKDSSDSIYKCSVNGIGYGKQKIYLGTPRKKSVYRPGDDRTLAYPYWDEHWDNVATFDGWDELCNEL